MREGRAQRAADVAAGQREAVVQLGKQVRDPLRRIQALQIADPLAVDRRVEQGREPQRLGEMRALARQFVQTLVLDLRNDRRAQGHHLVIEALENEAVQIDEISRHVNPHDAASAVPNDGAQQEAFDHNARAPCRFPARDERFAVRQPARPAD